MSARTTRTASSLRSAFRRRSVAVTLVLALAVGLLGSCGGGNGPEPGASNDIVTQRVGGDGLRFFVHDALLPSAGMDAVVTGVLATRDGCVLLELDGGRFPVVWPHGTSVRGTGPLVIELPSGERLEVGDEVSGGGGYLDADSVGIDVPDECLNEHGEIAVFNPDDEPVSGAS